MRKIGKCVVIILGTFIGAGFASGKEVAIFFNQFSVQGLWGIVVSAILFGLIVAMVLHLAKENNLSSYEELIHHNPFLLWGMKGFAFLCYCIMLSGAGTFLSEQLHFPFWLGTILVSMSCFILLLLKKKGLEKMNQGLVPVILIGMVMLFCYAMQQQGEIVITSQEVSQGYLLQTWWQAAFLYTGYNSIILFPILMEIHQYSLKKEEIAWLSFSVTWMIGVVGLLLYSMLSRYYPAILTVEMPTLVIAKNVHFILYILYSIAVFFAIDTTAFSCGYAFVNLNKEKNYFKNCLLLCIGGILLAKVGFSHLMSIAFPIFGYIGIFQWGYVAFKNRKRKSNNVKG